MAVTTLIACPACEKQFKGRPELLGKKVRCPACKHAFVVEALATGAEAAGAEPPARAGKVGAGAKTKPPPRRGAAKPAAPQPAPVVEDDEDEYGDAKAYGATDLDLAPRCPHCANEMESADAVVCLYCGYNTETREIGRTKKVFQTTAGEQFLWLLPGLGSALGVVLLAVFCLFFCLELPELVKDRWMRFLDHESMRMWATMIGLIIMWGVGYFAYKRLILQPKPPEKKND